MVYKPSGVKECTAKKKKECTCPCACEKKTLYRIINRVEGKWDEIANGEMTRKEADASALQIAKKYKVKAKAVTDKIYWKMYAKGSIHKWKS